MKKPKTLKKHLPELPVDRAPDQQETLIRLKCLIDNGELSLAYRMIITLLETESASPELLDALGTIYLRAGALDSAYATLQQAFQLNPNSADIYFHLAQVFAAKEDYPRSLALTRDVLRIQPDYSDAILLQNKLVEKSRGSWDASSPSSLSPASY